MDNEYIAHAIIDRKGNIVAQLFSFNLSGLLFFAKTITFAFPWYYLLALLALTVWTLNQPNEPIYLLLLALFGYHFFFPYTLKQYHGAEHKIFSHQGTKSLDTLIQISNSNIVNRNCSTNQVVLFFVLFLIGYYPLGGNMAALVALLGNVVIPRFLRPIEQRFFFPLSALLQEHCTTTEPEQKQLLVGLISYLTLVRREVVSVSLLQTEQEEQRLLLLRIEEEKQRQALLEERERIITETQWLEI
ncbi:MAG TPA: DUF1385 domain-containing protein [Bacillota bacterium]|nr:DUF1385 domain-containing protein [Bacillota bacterium]